MRRAEGEKFERWSSSPVLATAVFAKTALLPGLQPFPISVSPLMKSSREKRERHCKGEAKSTRRMKVGPPASSIHAKALEPAEVYHEKDF
jgi:hypothetical protein